MEAKLVEHGRTLEERFQPTTIRVGSNRLFQVLDFYWRSPESGDVWYKSSLSNRRFDPILSAGGRWRKLDEKLVERGRTLEERFHPKDAFYF